MKRLHVVTFDEALAPISIGQLEVKAARFARKRITACLDAAYLLLAERGLTLPDSVQAEQVAALKDALVFVADKLGDIPWFVSLSGLTQTLRITMHPLRIVQKLVEDFLVQLVAVTWRSHVVGVHGGNVVALTSYASGVAEVWQPGFDRVHRHPLQQA